MRKSSILKDNGWEIFQTDSLDFQKSNEFEAKKKRMSYLIAMTEKMTSLKQEEILGQCDGSID